MRCFMPLSGATEEQFPKSVPRLLIGFIILQYFRSWNNFGATFGHEMVLLLDHSSFIVYLIDFLGIIVISKSNSS